MIFITLPHNKLLARSELEPFADEKFNMTQKLKFLLGRTENIPGLGREENAFHLHIVLF